MSESAVDQADEFADQALALKKAVGGFRLRFDAALTPAQRDNLLTLYIKLGDEVDHLTNVAIKLALADMQAAIGHLSEITKDLNQAVDHLSEVGKVIRIATALIGLGAAIATASPDSLMAALKDTASSIRS